MQVAANGITLEVEIHGDAEGVPLVLIRGLGSQLVHWPRELVAGLAARGYRVVIFDNRDAGLSARCPAPGIADGADAILAAIRAGRVPPPAYRLDDMARDVVGLMDALGIGRAHVFGISMGGAIAQILACDHRERLLGAMIVMSSARLRGARLAEQLVSRPLDREDFIAAQLEGDRAWGSPGFPAPETWLRDTAARAWERGADAAGMNRQLLAILNAPDRRAALAGVTLPCLVIHGSEDRLIPPEAGREIAALIPGAEAEIIAGMGHVITPALALRIVERVDRFIRSRGGAGGAAGGAAGGEGPRGADQTPRQ